MKKKKNYKKRDNNKERFDKPAKPYFKKKTAAPKPKPKPVSLDEPMRLNKYVAHSGVCSRRQAAEHVKEGLVKVNGEIVLEPFYLVQPEDKVSFKDQPIRLEVRKVYYLLNKPKDVITTLKDDRGRRTVMDILGDEITARVYPVGRLDRATTGLLILTNDGDLAKKLSHPSHGVKKFYQVSLDKPLEQEHFDIIAAGFELDDGPVQVDGIGFIRGGKRSEVGLEIHIGRNRIVRRIFQHFGYEVKRLDRTYYAGLTKKDLPRGHYRPLSQREIVMLKHFT